MEHFLSLHNAEAVRALHLDWRKVESLSGVASLRIQSSWHFERLLTYRVTDAEQRRRSWIRLNHQLSRINLNCQAFDDTPSEVYLILRSRLNRLIGLWSLIGFCTFCCNACVLNETLEKFPPKATKKLYEAMKTKTLWRWSRALKSFHPDPTLTSTTAWCGASRSLRWDFFVFGCITRLYFLSQSPTSPVLLIAFCRCTLVD